MEAGLEEVIQLVRARDGVALWSLA